MDGDTRAEDRREQQAVARAMRDYLDAHGGVLVTPVDHTASGR
jgi:DNA-binding transcriptional regulator LsrR (DeoR family)